MARHAIVTWRVTGLPGAGEAQAAAEAAPAHQPHEVVGDRCEARGERTEPAGERKTYRLQE